MKQLFRRILYQVLPTDRSDYSNDELRQHYLGWVDLRLFGTTIAFIRADGTFQFDW